MVLGGTVSRGLAPGVPRPLVQIALGAVAGLIPQVTVVLDPEVFFLLLVPPLLFIDGWRIPTDELVRDRWAILHLSFGLVAATVLVVGGFVAWLAPGFPPGAALALAAALAPTDPIAVTSIARRVPIPRRMMNLLQAESLLNDATGLICLRFAILFMITGSFSPATVATTFVWVAAAGLGIGFGVAWAITRAKTWISARIGEESGSQIVVSLLIPFVAYLAAEAAAASGLFAAVAAGVTMARAEATGQALGATRMERKAVWDAVQFAANGVVFVLLGEQLPGILAQARQTVAESGQDTLWWPMLLIAAVYAAILTLRLAWVWASVALAQGRGGADLMPTWRLILATGLAGPRGAITFAGILTLPATLSGGAIFAERDLLILIATGVIVVSLIVAAIGLPVLLRSRAALPAPEAIAENATITAAATAAVAEIARIAALHPAPAGAADAYGTAAALASRRYLDRLGTLGQPPGGAGLDPRILRELRLAAVRAERKSIFQARRRNAIGALATRRLVRELDLLEAYFEG